MRAAMRLCSVDLMRREIPLLLMMMLMAAVGFSSKAESDCAESLFAKPLSQLHSDEEPQPVSPRLSCVPSPPETLRHRDTATLHSLHGGSRPQRANGQQEMARKAD
jgi:hypothetical protein